MSMLLKRFQLFVLVLMIAAVFHCPRRSTSVQATRPVFLNQKAGYSKTFATLGVVCKCCDGASGECRSTWDGTCPKLKCLPWKYQ